MRFCSYILFLPSQKEFDSSALLNQYLNLNSIQLPENYLQRLSVLLFAGWKRDVSECSAVVSVCYALVSVCLYFRDSRSLLLCSCVLLWCPFASAIVPMCDRSRSPTGLWGGTIDYSVTPLLATAVFDQHSFQYRHGYHNCPAQWALLQPSSTVYGTKLTDQRQEHKSVYAPLHPRAFIDTGTARQSFNDAPYNLIGFHARQVLCSVPWWIHCPVLY